MNVVKIINYHIERGELQEARDKGMCICDSNNIQSCNMFLYVVRRSFRLPPSFWSSLVLNYKFRL